MDVDPKKIDPMLFLSRRKQRLVKMKKAGKVKKGQKVLGKRRR